jgi:hypothetical protein
MVVDMTSMIEFVRIMTQLLSNTPYHTHMISFVTAIINIMREISFADFSFQVLITCGKKVSVVIAPAE